MRPAIRVSAATASARSLSAVAVSWSTGSQGGRPSSFLSCCDLLACSGGAAIARTREAGPWRQRASGQQASGGSRFGWHGKARREGRRIVRWGLLVVVLLVAVLALAACGSAVSRHRQPSQKVRAECDDDSYGLAVGYWTRIVAHDMQVAAAAETSSDPNLKWYGEALAQSATSAWTQIAATQPCHHASVVERARLLRALSLWRRVGTMIARGASGADLAVLIRQASSATPR